MDKPESISQKKIDKINKVIKDMVFTYEGPISDWSDGEFEYQFQIIGQQPLISVGDWHNFLIIDILIIDGSYKTSLMLKFLPYILTDYRTLNHLGNSISNELQYFFGGDHVRIANNTKHIKISDEFQQKIDSIEPDDQKK